MSCDFFQYLIEVGWVSVAAESAGGFDEKLAQCARSGTPSVLFRRNGRISKGRLSADLSRAGPRRAKAKRNAI
jgi:hypothetical protein